ncbi:MAG: cytidylate kinase-like family protein [Desulfobacteraceae bacterium]|nr:cytidylate kinase-like family protein [Desulfobacteraceae bacterium]
MNGVNLSIKKFITEQTEKRLNGFSNTAIQKDAVIPIITVCMEPGSGGHLIAFEIAKRLNVKLYDKKILVPMAHSANLSSSKLEEIEKERPAGVQDFISALIDRDYIYTGDYLRHLKEAVEIIGRIGKGVILGRGANFILPAKGRFSIRVVAPMDIRTKNVSFKYGISLEEARKKIRRREKRRKAFIKESFHENIEDTSHYDLIINTGRMDLQTSVECAIGAAIGAQVNKSFEKETIHILKNNR